MIEQAKGRALPILNRIPDVTPAAQACCGVCRTCTTTNVLTVGGAAITAAAFYLARLVNRRTRRILADQL